MSFTKRMLLLFLIMLLILPIGFIAKADDNLSLLSPDNMHKMSDGPTVKYNVSTTNGTHVLNANITSKGLKKGYYSTIFYNALNNNLFNYRIISFNISNKSNSELNMNFIINKDDGTSLSITNGSYVLLKNGNSSLLEKTFPSDGSIAIPKGFNGTIFIPLKNLKENSPQNSTQNKTSMTSSLSSWWGILITSKENEKKSFSLSNFKLMNTDGEIQKFENFNVSFNGDTRVQIPVIGESIARYNIVIHDSNGNLVNKKVTYKISTPKKGISVDNNGVLKIKPKVSPQSIKIDAIIDDNMAYESKEIQLYKSWTINAKEVDGTSKSVPQPHEVKKLTGSTYNFLLSDSSMNLIRILAIISLIVFISSYFYWEKNYKNEKFEGEKYVTKKGKTKFLDKLFNR